MEKYNDHHLFKKYTAKYIRHEFCLNKIDQRKRGWLLSMTSILNTALVKTKRQGQKWPLRKIQPTRDNFNYFN